MKFRNRAFTLVELIIVIAIIAVLAVISVLVVSEWIGKSRDTRRLGDVAQIEKSLDVAMVKSNSFPNPDNYVAGTASGVQIVYKGIFGDGAVTKTNLKTVPKDPATDSYYIYAVSSDGLYYQVSTVLENGGKISYLSNNAYAATPTAGVRGNYKGVLPYVLTGSYFIANFPSIIFTSSTGADLLSTGTYFVVNGKENLPYVTTNTPTMHVKDTVTLIKEIVNSGTVLTSANITSFYTNKTPITSIISGSLLTSLGGNTIMNSVGSTLGTTVTTTGSSSSSLPVVAFNSSTVYVNGQQFTWTTASGANVTVTAYGNGSGYVAGTDGGIGCNTPDIVVWNSTVNPKIFSACNLGATIARSSSVSITNCNGSGGDCNSAIRNVLGNYYQRGRNDIVTAGTYVASTYVGSLTNGSVGNTNFYKGDAVNGEWWQTEVGVTTPTRWTGTNPQGPCPSGRHIPSQSDWQSACNAISNTSCANNGTTVTLMQNTLLLPIGGFRNGTNGNYSEQTQYTHYWSSSPVTSIYPYYLRMGGTYISHGSEGNRADGSNIRCTKN